MVLFLGLGLSCRRGEVKAMIVGYSSPLESLTSICGESWQVAIDGQPFRSRACSFSARWSGCVDKIRARFDCQLGSVPLGKVHFLPKTVRLWERLVDYCIFWQCLKRVNINFAMRETRFAFSQEGQIRTNYQLTYNADKLPVSVQQEYVQTAGVSTGQGSFTIRLTG